MKIMIYGLSGRMGHQLYRMASDQNIKVVCGIDRFPNTLPVKTYPSLQTVTEAADVVIDFSGSESLGDLLAYGKKTKTALVLASTGYTDKEVQAVTEAARDVAIVRSGNMSLGINLIQKLVKTAYEVLGEDYDIEIIEKHHNQKIDAPSGTALLLADSINETAHKEYVYGRKGLVGKRGKEIGIHAVRGGTIVGEHEVVFAGDDEVITISHTALSRKIFATGALRAAAFLTGKKTGLYSMQDVIKS